MASKVAILNANARSASGGKPKEEAGDSKKAASTTPEKGWFSKWWNGLDKESSPGQRFVVLVLVLLVAYIEFHLTTTIDPDTKVKSYGHVWVALGLLLVAAIYSPPKGWFTKAFVVFDLVVIIVASFFPGVAEMRHTTAAIATTWSSKQAASMKQYAEDYKAGKTTPAQATAAPQTQGNTIERDVTEEMFTEVRIPTGRQFAIDCPEGGLAKVYHQDAPQGIVYDCATDTIELGGNLRYFRIGFSSKTENPVHITVRIF